jgi:zinc-ribbon family
MRRFPPKSRVDVLCYGFGREKLSRSSDERRTVFFFIAGIQPKTVEIESHPRMCSSCGLYQARLKRVDHYFSLFFIPVLRVKKGDPLIQCQSCGSKFRESGQEAWRGPSTKPEDRCPHCGVLLEPAFRFCPNCGKAIT